MHGACDNLVSCVCLAWHVGERPMLVCPSMNTWMWSHPATRENVKKARYVNMIGCVVFSQVSLVKFTQCRSYGVQIVWPISKRLMCGDVGAGAMEEPGKIARQVREALENPKSDLLESNRSVILGIGAAIAIVCAMAMFKSRSLSFK